MEQFFQKICENLNVMPWKQIWQQKILSVSFFGAFLLFLAAVLLLRDKIAKNSAGVRVLSYFALMVSFVFVGLFLKAQPTTTNIVIILNGVREGAMPLALFLMEPFIFLSFLFIGITVLLWGRGAYCGWLCPYGAMLELLSRFVGKFLPRLRKRLPDSIHGKLIYFKYALLAVIVGASFYSFMLSEYLAEAEPFKTFVLKLNRTWPFVLYFSAVTLFSLVVYRAYCRYLCPLGAALSLPSLVKGLPVLRLKRHETCSSCSLCRRECESAAILSNGSVNNAECLYCLDCQTFFWDEIRCPGRKLIRKKEEAKQAAGRGAAAQATLLSSAAALFMLLSCCFPSTAAAGTLTVGAGGDYATISQALKKARSGDIIQVAAGVYREQVRIDKAVQLKGIGSPELAGTGGLFIEIAHRGVVVEGFTIKDDGAASDVKSAGIYIAKGSDGAVVRNNRLLNVMHGIWSVSARGSVIEHNVVDGKKDLERNYRGNGIYLTDSQESLVAENTMVNCRDGIYLEVSHDGKILGNEIRDSRYGIHTMWADRTMFSRNRATGNLVGVAVMYSKQSEVSDNVTAGNQTHGLLLNQTTRSMIRNNITIGNSKGVFFYNSVFNTVTANLVMNNSLGFHNCGGSMDNTVEGNSFISNEVQVKFIAGRNQQWDGNYWSDYLGWDTRGVGTGDVAYESNSVVDHILWRYPAAKLLYASPSFQALWMLEKQFPLLKVPRVVDRKPFMKPLHTEWREALARYPYAPERYFGEVDKLAMH